MKKGRVNLLVVILSAILILSNLSSAILQENKADDKMSLLLEKTLNKKIHFPSDYQYLKDNGYISSSDNVKLILTLNVPKIEPELPVMEIKKVSGLEVESLKKDLTRGKKEGRFVDEADFQDARSKVVSFVEQKKGVAVQKRVSVKSALSAQGSASSQGSMTPEAVKKIENPQKNSLEKIFAKAKQASYLLAYQRRLSLLLDELRDENISEPDLLPLLESSGSSEAAEEQGSTGAVKDLRIIGAVALEVPYDSFGGLVKLDSVKGVYLDKKVHVLLNESVPMINATVVWEMQDANGTNVTGEGIKIAIIDTGVDYTHPDLGNCTQAQFLNGTCAKVIGGYDFVNNDLDPMDDYGHGTHVAATAAGNGTLYGVAPGAQILAYKVCDIDGNCYVSNIILSVEQAVVDGANVISMSLGSYDCDPFDAESQAVDTAVDQGVVNVIAAGNSGPSARTVGSPGCARKAITVAAACKPSQIGIDVYCDTSIAEFSSRGPARIFQKPDVAAPGVLICAAELGDWYSASRCIDDNHIAISGTSMATPHVAGAVALILQKHPDWTPFQVKAAIRYTADDLGEDILTQGFGLINVGKAAALENPPPVAFIEGVPKVVYVDI